MDTLRQFPKAAGLLETFLDNARKRTRRHDLYFHNLTHTEQEQILACLYYETDPATRYYLVPVDQEKFHHQLCLLFLHWQRPTRRFLREAEAIKHTIFQTIEDHYWKWICQTIAEIECSLNAAMNEQDDGDHYSQCQSRYVINTLKALKLG
jgi:hypothetical protein